VLAETLKRSSGGATTEFLLLPMTLLLPTLLMRNLLPTEVRSGLFAAATAEVAGADSGRAWAAEVPVDVPAPTVPTASTTGSSGSGNGGGSLAVGCKVRQASQRGRRRSFVVGIRAGGGALRRVHAGQSQGSAQTPTTTAASQSCVNSGGDSPLRQSDNLTVAAEEAAEAAESPEATQAAAVEAKEAALATTEEAAEAKKAAAEAAAVA
jgi:hypothetical protein